MWQQQQGFGGQTWAQTRHDVWESWCFLEPEAEDLKWWLYST